MTVADAPRRDCETHRRREDAVAAAKALEQWGSACRWRGPDPYDGLNANGVRRVLGRSPLGLRILTQAVKRSPVDVRPLLGIRPDLNAATLGHLLTAYASNGFLPAHEARRKLAAAVEHLKELQLRSFARPCWGYPFDVQSRVFFYPRTMPNTIASVFAGLGLLDAYEASGDSGALDLAIGVGDFFVRDVPQTGSDTGGYFGYLPGDQTPIHNANALVSALLARLWVITARPTFGKAASEGIRYTVARQRPDGSWPYGERPGLSWIDGFHTGYVLDGLLTCIDCGIADAGADAAWRLGLRYYVDHLTTARGEAKYMPDSLFPIDTQCVAQAIKTLSRAAQREPELAERRWRVAEYALARLRRNDGAFSFQRRRLWTNRIAHPRWVQAPMLAALTRLITSVQ